MITSKAKVNVLKKKIITPLAPSVPLYWKTFKKNVDLRQTVYCLIKLNFFVGLFVKSDFTIFYFFCTFLLILEHCVSYDYFSYLPAL